MKKRLKIVTAWLMLALIIYNAGFCFFVVELSVQLNRNLVEKYLSDADQDELLVLKISEATSIIRNGNHEIIFEGKLYDVRNEIRKNGTIYFYCIHDTEEENLVCALKTAVNNNTDFQNERQNNHSIGVLKHFTRDYFHKDYINENPEAIDKSNDFIEDETFLSFNFSSVITPPPKG